MKRIVAASAVAALVYAHALAQGPADQKAPAQPSSFRGKLTDDAIRDAIKQALAEAPLESKSADATVLSGDQYRRFSRKVEEATVPGCLNPDALKHQPTSVEYKGWTLGVGGLFAAPFWLAAVATGKCR